MNAEKITPNKRILLAEDDKFISIAYRDGLKRAGFEVIYAPDGETAIDMITKELPDLILLDIIMPGKNGFEVLEEIKKHDATKAIPVIMLSNLGQDVDIQKGLGLGAADYLIKANFSMAEIINKINSYLDK